MGQSLQVTKHNQDPCSLWPKPIGFAEVHAYSRIMQMAHLTHIFVYLKYMFMFKRTGTASDYARKIKCLVCIIFLHICYMNASHGKLRMLDPK